MHMGRLRERLSMPQLERIFRDHDGNMKGVFILYLGIHRVSYAEIIDVMRAIEISHEKN